MGLVSTVLYFIQGFCLVFHWKCSRMLTTPLRQLTGGRYQVIQSCVEVLLYVSFPGLKNALPFRLSEAECVALGDAVKELLFLGHVWRFMLPSKVMPCFPIFEDNQGAVRLAQSPVTNSYSKHIDVRHHFLQELVRQRDIKVVQVPSECQHAYILNKSLAFDLFAFHREPLMNLK